MRFIKTTVLPFLLLCAISMQAQEVRTAKVVFAGDITTFSDISRQVPAKETPYVMFGTAVSEFSIATSPSDAHVCYALSMSSSHLIRAKHTDFTNELKANKIHHAGLKEHKDFTTFTHNGLKYGFVAFGSTPMSLTKRDSVIVKTVISRLKFKTDIVVAAYSYDTKSALAKSTEGYIEDLKYFSHLCIDAGADVVYVSGCKSQLPIELYGDRLIIYGQEGCPIEAELSDDGSFAGGKFLRNGNGIIEMTKAYFPETALQLDKKKIQRGSGLQAQGTAHTLLTEAAKYRGRRYRSGASGPQQFDCSGFTSYIFKLMGYSLPRTAQEQSKVGTHVERDDLHPGDLVFFKRPTASGAGHVGIVYSVNSQTGDFTFIHASTTRGVVIDNFSSLGYFVKRYMGARRVIEDKYESLPAVTDEIEGIDVLPFNTKQAR